EESRSGGETLIAATPFAAFGLVDDLARLFDDISIAGVSFDQFDGLVPTELDQYWQRSIEFLNIAHKGWAGYLADKGLIDPAARRDQLLRREAERLAAGAGGPIVAAGSTGTLPAVANLLTAIAKRPNGAVVLPGLDQNLDRASFDLIDGGKVDGQSI